MDNVHEGNRDYRCDFCGNSFSQNCGSKNRIHTVLEGSKDHKCDSCGKSFSGPYLWNTMDVIFSPEPLLDFCMH